jgi:Peptidase A4 family
MAKSWSWIVVFAMVLATVSTGVGLSAAAAGPALTHPPPRIYASTTLYSSYNWAGYAVNSTKASVTSVVGVFTQPTVSCSKGSTTYVATWVGIDGLTTSDLVQTGTQATCSGGTASYGAWWEVLPAPETSISSITVHAGDTITASVTYSSTTGKFSMSIVDGTHSFTKTEKVSSATKVREAAECIVERPEVGSALSKLADFGTATFSSCTATIGGTTAGIGSFSNVWQLDMVDNAGTAYLATTGSLSSSGKTFTVTWLASGP